MGSEIELLPEHTQYKRSVQLQSEPDVRELLLCHVPRPDLQDLHHPLGRVFRTRDLL